MIGDVRSQLGSSEVALMLGVKLPTLAMWERRFGFPSACSGPGERRRFMRDEVLALRDALAEESSVAMAVRRARSRVADGLVRELVGACTEADARRCQAVLDSALARGPGGTLASCIVLDGIEKLFQLLTPDAPQWRFTAGVFSEWLADAPGRTDPPRPPVPRRRLDCAGVIVTGERLRTRVLELLNGPTVSVQARGGAPA
jgi:hypothetical protein